MAASIISVVNQKGGTGKTTLTMQLAGTLARRPDTKVLIIDADAQASATSWARAATEDLPFPATIVQMNRMEDKLHREVKKFIQDYHYILIDCPPSIDSLTPQSALLISDLALVPMVPTTLDVWSFLGIRKLISNAQAFNETLVARIVLNHCESTTMHKDFMVAIKEFEFPPCTTRMGHRTAYQQAALLGRTVHDLGYKAAVASSEINALTEEIIKVLHPVMEKGVAAL